jgi:hypothetical protein
MAGSTASTTSPIRLNRGVCSTGADPTALLRPENARSIIPGDAPNDARCSGLQGWARAMLACVRLVFGPEDDEGFGEARDLLLGRTPQTPPGARRSLTRGAGAAPPSPSTTRPNQIHALNNPAGPIPRPPLNSRAHQPCASPRLTHWPTSCCETCLIRPHLLLLLPRGRRRCAPGIPRPPGRSRRPSWRR